MIQWKLNRNLELYSFLDDQTKTPERESHTERLKTLLKSITGSFRSWPSIYWTLRSSDMEKVTEMERNTGKFMEQYGVNHQRANVL